jgi:hypothetical protein
MRSRSEIAANAGQGVGAGRTSQNRLNGKSNILATACSCGGPGGRPGMQPICIGCFKFHKSITAAIARQAGCYFTERSHADRLARCTT